MYTLMSDLHFHGWSAFATKDERGINSRLNIILAELERAAEVTKERGGSAIVIAGDLFHVRGNIAPTVLNPLKEQLAYIKAQYQINFYAIPGNHDLESDDTWELHSATEALTEFMHVITEPLSFSMNGRNINMIPWINSLDDLREVIATHPKLKRGSNSDLIIHAPLNGVIQGIPENGLTPEELADADFGRVFVGHYHNHKDFGNGVYSIGATTHQTWSDVGSKAGFLIIDEEGAENDVQFIETEAPKFIDFDIEDFDDAKQLAKVDGNYVRVKFDSTSLQASAEARELLETNGAAGILFNIVPTPKNAATKRTSTVTSGASLEISVSEFVKAKKYSKQVDKECSAILGEV